MDLSDWDLRYRLRSRPEDCVLVATPLLQKVAPGLPPGRALDLACGAGRNATYLAELGWTVTAVDGAPEALALLHQDAATRGLTVQTVQADLERHEFIIQPASWDLILMSYYLQRDLIPDILRGVRPQGLAIAIVHITEPGEQPAARRAEPGELRRYFAGWEILHDYVGKPNDPAHQRSVAEIVARKSG